MFCPKCGEIVSDIAWTCPSCKASLRGGRTKVNKDCDHRHAQPDTVDSPKNWQNPSKWDDPRAQIRLFGQTITRENVEAFEKRFQEKSAEILNNASGRPQNKTEEIIWLLKQFFLRYKDFSGRTGRREFWMTTLILLVFTLAISVFGGFLAMLWTTAIAIPSIAMDVRRLHDTGSSGKALLVGLIPYFGIVAVIYLLTRPSAPSNQWGPDTSA